MFYLFGAVSGQDTSHTYNYDNVIYKKKWTLGNTSQTQDIILFCGYLGLKNTKKNDNVMKTIIHVKMHSLF